MSSEVKFEMKDMHDSNPVFWVFVALMGDKYAEILKDHTHEKAYNVEVKINGIEVDFAALCKHLMDSFEVETKAAAIELLKERFGDIYNAVTRLGEEIETRARIEFGVRERE